TTARCDTAPTLTLRRDASPASPVDARLSRAPRLRLRLSMSRRLFEALSEARNPRPVQKADSAMAALSKHAARIQVEEGPRCSPQQAFARAYARYPELAQRELAERRG
ncbi:MAG: hypothetical protein ACREXS_11900, partial [Gammaproteobacteria bacterium]